LFAVKEATAAEPLRASAPQQPGTPRPVPRPGTRREVPPQPSETTPAVVPLVRPDSEVVDRASEVVLDGLRREVEQTQASVDRYRVEIEKKFAIAVACIVFVLLGAPIALRFPRGGVGLTIGVSFAVFAVYYVGLLGGEALADKGFVDPAIAMWITDLLLGAAGIYLTLKLGTEGSTSRGSETLERLSRFRERFRRAKAA
jgi:lipopolysaccharide export system permease protein